MGHTAKRRPHRALKLTQEYDEYGPANEVTYPVEGDTTSEGEEEEENGVNVLTGPLSILFLTPICSIKLPF